MKKNEKQEEIVSYNDSVPTLWELEDDMLDTIVGGTSICLSKCSTKCNINCGTNTIILEP